MVDTAREGFAVARSRPVVRVLLVASLFLGLASEAFDRLWAKHVIDSVGFPNLPGANDHVVWFGLIALASTVVSLIATMIFRRLRPDALGPGTPARLLALLVSGRVLATVIFALAGSLPLAMVMIWSRDLLGTLFHPVQHAWLNRNIDPRSRATVLSFHEQVASVGEIGGGPPLGWLGSRLGVRAALIASAGLLAPMVVVFFRATHLRDHVDSERIAVEDASPAEPA